MFLFKHIFQRIWEPVENQQINYVIGKKFTLISVSYTAPPDSLENVKKQASELHGARQQGAYKPGFVEKCFHKRNSYIAIHSSFTSASNFIVFCVFDENPVFPKRNCSTVE